MISEFPLSRHPKTWAHLNENEHGEAVTAFCVRFTALERRGAALELIGAVLVGTHCADLVFGAFNPDFDQARFFAPPRRAPWCWKCGHKICTKLDRPWCPTCAAREAVR